MITVIYLIRHGETEWNRRGRWQGHADVPLSEEGRLQAAALADRLRREQIRFDHIYASDLSRAMETAELVAQALDLPVQPFPALREIDVGGWSGLTRAEIKAQFPGAFDTAHHAPDAETPALFALRVGGALDELAARHAGERLALVTHGGTIRALLRYVLGAAVEHEIPFIGNTSLTVVERTADAWRVRDINDLAHVAHLPAAGWP